jgi:hypothetical protein
MMLDALALVLTLLAQEATTTITITLTMKDGNAVAGVTDVTTFDFESTLGKMKISLKDLRMIRFDATGAQVSTSDGTVLKGTISVTDWKVVSKLGELKVQTKDLLMVAVSSVVVTNRPLPPPPSAPGGTPPPAAQPGVVKPPVAKPAANPALTPEKSLKLAAVVSRTLRSSDGKSLYLLDATDARVLIVKMETLEKEKEIALSGGETAMALAPSGKVLATGGKRTVTIASIPEARKTRSFTIENDVTDLVALDDQTVLALTNGGLVIISVPKQAVVGKSSYSSVGSGGRLMMSKDGKKVYTGEGSILLPDKAQGRDDFMVSRQGSRNSGGEYVMSPDGRFAVATQGGVVRLGKSFVADMVDVAKVVPHWASAWAPAKKRLYLVTSSGFVKEYDTETWELAKSWSLGYRFTEVFVDEAGGFLVGVGQAVPASTGSYESARYQNQLPPAGDLFKFELPK